MVECTRCNVILYAFCSPKRKNNQLTQSEQLQVSMCSEISILNYR